uniref:ZAD domain-containing protein n=1 Tax=Anopheles epiroticus TaxID=199890 RepID=A0A182PS08_9DIPT
MAYNRACALCLTTDALWFMEVFDEHSSRTFDMALIISKHLWFDLKPAAQPCICGDCWTSIHDFHLFYTKLESIHSDEIDAVNSTKQQITELEVQEPHQMQECVFHGHESKHTIATGTKIITPQVVATYCTTDASESSNTPEKKHFVEVEDYASNDDDDDHF